MKTVNADVYCCQEVDEFLHFKKNLTDFHGIFKKRTGSRKDGCAIFYKKNLFKEIETVEVEFNDTAPSPSLQLDNVALFVVLQKIGIH